MSSMMHPGFIVKMMMIRTGSKDDIIIAVGEKFIYVLFSYPPIFSDLFSDIIIMSEKYSTNC